MSILNRARVAIYDGITEVMANAIALFSPVKANEYRYFRSVYKRSYVAANLTGPYQLHRPSVTSADKEVLSARSRVNARVKDQERNNPLVSGMVLKNATAVVGDEIGFKFNIEGPNGRPNDKLNKLIERRFYAWSESACVDGDSLTSACHLIENHLILDGEILSKDDYDNGPGNPYRIQPLESEHLDGSKTNPGHGIEFDAKGRPAWFWIYPKFPDGYDGLSDSVKVPASDICHLYTRVRASQRRGISPLAPALQKVYMIDDLEDAELVASRAAASFGLIITSPIQDAAPIPPKTGDSGETVQDDNGRDRGYLPSGGIFEAMPGEEVQSFKNERPNPNFDPFRRGCQRVAAHSVGMSYEVATGDYSQVNYSSARMGDGVNWANVKRRQAKIRSFLNRTFRKWLMLEIITVGIPGLSVSEYFRNRSMYDNAATWQLAGREAIDEYKAIKTLELEVKNGVNSRTRWCAERGRDFGEVTKELASEKEDLTALGIYREPDQTGGLPREVMANEE